MDHQHILMVNRDPALLDFVRILLSEALQRHHHQRGPADLRADRRRPPGADHHRPHDHRIERLGSPHPAPCGGGHRRDPGDHHRQRCPAPRPRRPLSLPLRRAGPSRGALQRGDPARCRPGAHRRGINRGGGAPSPRTDLRSPVAERRPWAIERMRARHHAAQRAHGRHGEQHRRAFAHRGEGRARAAPGAGTLIARLRRVGAIRVDRGWPWYSAGRAPCRTMMNQPGPFLDRRAEAAAT